MHVGGSLTKECAEKGLKCAKAGVGSNTKADHYSDDAEAGSAMAEDTERSSDERAVARVVIAAKPQIVCASLLVLRWS